MIKIKEISSNQKIIFKTLLLINTFIILGLATYYLVFRIIQQREANIFDMYIFLPLFIVLLGWEVMLMSIVSYNSSFKANSSQDNAMFNLGLILIIIGIITVFILLLINKLRPEI
ncbi:MAG: hypothetical protein K6G28_02925 [Acholeplasmatales bacterium]|nr:hypothetical protein [Acholeplasmatales bacterium]